MRRFRFLILTASLGLLTGLTLLALWFRSQPLIDAELLMPGNEREYPYSSMTLRLKRPVELAADQEIQFRIAGKWLAPQKLQSLPEPLSGEVRHIPNRRGAEACRFHLTYRRQSPREEVFLFFVRHRWWRTAPKLCLWLTKRLPAHRRWQHTVLEFELPKQPYWSPQRSNLVYNYRARVDAGFALLFAFGRPWSGTTQHGRYAAAHHARNNVSL
jgi:hypothetical protein